MFFTRNDRSIDIGRTVHFAFRSFYFRGINKLYTQYGLNAGNGIYLCWMPKTLHFRRSIETNVLRFYVKRAHIVSTNHVSDPLTVVKVIFNREKDTNNISIFETHTHTQNFKLQWKLLFLFCAPKKCVAISNEMKSFPKRLAFHGVVTLFKKSDIRSHICFASKLLLYRY